MVTEFFYADGSTNKNASGETGACGEWQARFL